MNTQTMNLDVTKRPQITPVLYLGQGDKSGTILEASIYDNGLALTLTSYSVKLCIQAPNGAGYYECEGTVSGNKATFTIDETYAAAVDGVSEIGYVEVLSGDTVICSTNRFRTVVLKNATEGADPNGAYTNGVERWLENAQDELDDAVEASDAAAERATAAAEAAEGIILDDIPTMSPTIKGGATLGSGLHVQDGALSLGDLVQSGSGSTVQTDGCALYSVEGEGWSEQDGTPTPENPQEIRVCRGRNLSVATSDPSNPDNGFSSSGDGTAAMSYSSADGGYYTTGHRSLQLGHLEAGTYTFSFDAKLRSDGTSSYVMVPYLPSWDTTGMPSVSSLTSSYQHFTKTFTLNSDSDCAIAVYNTVILKDFQLEKGSTPTPYVPYGHVGIDFHGVNMFDPSYLISKGWIKVGDEYYGTTNSLYGDYSPTQGFEAGEQYRFAFHFKPGTAGKGLYVSFHHTDDTTIPTLIARTEGDYTLMSTSGKTVDHIMFSYDGSSYIYLSNVELKKASESDLYQPFFAPFTVPIPLPSKGWAGAADVYADALAVDSAGGYRWTNNTGGKVFDGTEAWTFRTWSSIKVAFTTVSDMLLSYSYGAPGFVSHYPIKTTSGDLDGTARFAATLASANYPLFVVYDNTYAVSGAWETWLSTHNVTALYPLATPTTEHGYIDLPDLPNGATVSIPELESIGVSWFVAGCEALVQHAANERKYIESLIAELATA